MTQYFCSNCGCVWSGGNICTHCKIDGDLYDQVSHSPGMVSRSNAYIGFKDQFKDDPLWHEASKIIGQQGSASSIACFGVYLQLLRDSGT